MMRGCKNCDNILDDSIYFCDENCENNFRNTNKELYIVYKKDNKQDAYCPIRKFQETDTELLLDNGHNTYRIPKEKIKKWKIDKCSCLAEFTNIDYLRRDGYN